MRQYRIYTFRDDGHFEAVQHLECANHKYAVQKARQLVDGKMANSGRPITLSRDFPSANNCVSTPQLDGHFRSQPSCP